ncbi:hypothetical protein COX03_03215 [Candidatus Woesebacteria bacterium CG22_combo_CG10-13_8_21_14_all_39_10]|uniref:Uncharacterized protein n=3 Tax=Candidatus Woeseibacteriota TaxID=1752722 RepID=A0A2M7X9F5_9BACT|nr:MAG: hypothetical protein COX03_03215 [Candidatus Woesebacteria bacterium CG22_combo_CG10-13_8_21_14_all_39_10]PIU71994.1 MAG: hypothetical protein COS80_00225 [Candidatus Woesebacteria bacterium CG06_land_8_20_14_3_00_39_27]PJA42796.1 MAG: hypothetical protein CO176_01475 [Candidatus Woesebacteria bacterium CG_4_9_14_3_um_filter_39_10]
MKKVLRIIIVLIFSVLFVYALLPNPKFPNPPEGALQSEEPGDVENLSLRRAYYTNLTREEVMKHYQNEFKGYRLNYPSEEAIIIIRDQTKSTFLEEIVHPFRESFYVNGFEPKSAEYAIIKAGQPWRQKITVKYVASNIIIRSSVMMLTGIVLLFLFEVWLKKHD